MSNLILVAPMDGWSSALEKVPDPVFSGKLMGDGLVHRALPLRRRNEMK